MSYPQACAMARRRARIDGQAWAVIKRGGFFWAVSARSVQPGTDTITIALP